MKKLHKKLAGIQGPDDSLEIERYTTSNLAPRRNVKKITSTKFCIITLVSPKRKMKKLVGAYR